jgi:ABC-type uncharacterized transport system permease subunit
MRGRVVPWTAIAGVVLSAIVGLVVAALLNTYLSDSLVRGIVSCATGIAVAVSIGRNVIARHISPSTSHTGPDPD